MLTIVTGTPGAGKTLHTLSRILDEHRSGSEAERPFFVNGVPDLDYEFFQADELQEPEKWDELPQGSIIFIDEAQRVFPQRPASRKVPDFVQAMATHRHQGFDLFITTQDASNVDAFVRRMCNRHIHIHRILNREVATVYEYDHYESNPTGYHEKKAAISVKAWKYPKKIYTRYKSATQHTYKARTPFKLYLVAAALVATVAACVLAFVRFTDEGRRTEIAMGSDAIESPVILQDGPNIPGQPPGMGTGPYLALFKPRIPGLPFTAPAYDQVMEVKSAPKPYCMIVRPHNQGTSYKGQCKCYTQQLTKMVIADDLCRTWAEDGFFDFTRESVQSGRGASAGGEAGRPAARAPQPLKRDYATLANQDHEHPH